MSAFTKSSHSKACELAIARGRFRPTLAAMFISESKHVSAHAASALGKRPRFEADSLCASPVRLARDMST